LRTSCTALHLLHLTDLHTLSVFFQQALLSQQKDFRDTLDHLHSQHSRELLQLTD
jgi:hypothetical protein